jgi:DNA-directed RNA polymerase subunit RPC12/RpoP
MERVEPTATPPKESDSEERRLSCPWCGSESLERVGAYGSHLMVSQYICLTCHSPFERIRK